MADALSLLHPRPQRVRATGASFALNGVVRISLVGLGGDASAVRRLESVLSRAGFQGSPSGDGAGWSVELTLAEHHAGSEQGYSLRVREQGISLVAATLHGLFSGVCTLEQLLETAQRDMPARIAEVEIEDWPDFAVRGVMLDISRDKVPTLATLFGLVDRLASWKVNQLQLYMEHTFAYAGHERVWKDASPLFPGEIAALDAYCRERHIELVPNQNSFGHMQRWLVHEPYRRLAECPDEGSPWGLCATDPRALELLEDLYDQLLSNFKSPLFNVGLDETVDLGLGRSRQACSERGRKRVYLEFLKAVHLRLTRRRKRMQFWGDMMADRPDLMREIPGDAVALEWGYEADHPFAARLQHWLGAGLNVYVCPGTSSWNSIAGRTENALSNLAAAAHQGRELGASGLLVTDWGDNGHLQPQCTSYLGLLVGAGLSWNAKAEARPDDVAVAALLGHHVFGDRTAVLGQVARDLGNAYREIGVDWPNGSALFWLLLEPDMPLLKHGIRAEALARTRAYLDEAAAPLRTAGARSDEASLALEEMGWQADTLSFSCRVALERCAAGASQRLADVPATKRAALAKELGGLIERHRTNWLRRNRAGGLGDSTARLERLRAELDGR